MPSTNEPLQQQVSGHEKRLDQADMLMAVMVEEIKQLRAMLRRIAPPS